MNVQWKEELVLLDPGGKLRTKVMGERKGVQESELSGLSWRPIDLPVPYLVDANMLSWLKMILIVLKYEVENNLN